MKIRITDLTKRFGDILALDRLNLTISGSGVYGLVGPNGAGKTTCLSVLATLVRPTCGDAFVKRYSVVGSPREVRELMGTYLQGANFYSYRTVFDNLMLMAKSRGLGHVEANEEIFSLLDTLELSDVIHGVVGRLSHGTRKVLGVLQAFIGQPELVLLDEPLSGLDPILKNTVREFIRAYSKNRLVIISTHILSEAERLCAQIGLLHQGRLLLEGRLSDLRKERYMLRLRIGNQPKKCADMLGRIKGVEVELKGGTLTIRYAKDCSQKILESLTKYRFDVLYMEKGQSVEEVFLQALKKDST